MHGTLTVTLGRLYICILQPIKRGWISENDGGAVTGLRPL